MALPTIPQTHAEFMADERLVAALKATREMLAQPLPNRRRFSMSTTCVYDGYDCKTVACIGGWMAFFLNRKTRYYTRETFVLNARKSAAGNLFYANERDAPPMSRITQAQAVVAIDRFLAGETLLWSV